MLWKLAVMNNQQLLNNKTLESVKSEVKELFAQMKTVNPAVKLGHAYDVYSKMHGFKDWNVLSAFLKRKAEGGHE